MKGLYAVYRKEMSHYFVSPIAYIVVADISAAHGIFLHENTELSDRAGV